MAALGRKLRTLQGGRVSFWCPACDEAHVVIVEGENAWDFNKNGDCPTFSPSIRLTGVQKIVKDGKWMGEWKRDASGKPLPYCCHSSITDGVISFYHDCTHSLKGIKQELPDFPLN